MWYNYYKLLVLSKWHCLNIVLWKKNLLQFNKLKYIYILNLVGKIYSKKFNQSVFKSLYCINFIIY